MPARFDKISHGARKKANPAPGYRSYNTGLLSDVGSLSYSKSSTSYDSGDYHQGIDLDFNSLHLSPSRTNYRALGFQLRCLSE